MVFLIQHKTHFRPLRSCDKPSYGNGFIREKHGSKNPEHLSGFKLGNSKLQGLGASHTPRWSLNSFCIANIKVTFENVRGINLVNDLNFTQGNVWADRPLCTTANTFTYSLLFVLIHFRIWVTNLHFTYYCTLYLPLSLLQQNSYFRMLIHFWNEMKYNMLILKVAKKT